MRVNRILLLASVFLVGILVGVKLLIDAFNYDERPYVSYSLSRRFSTGEALIDVNKNNDLLSPSNGIGFTALLTQKGNLIPLKYQTYSGQYFWSKDGSVMAFKGAMMPDNSQCLGHIGERNQRLYTYAYDISTHREIYSAAPTRQFSKRIERLLRLHGGITKNLQSQTILIALEDQAKFEKADVNKHHAFCD